MITIKFMNRERVSLADVDTDWLSEDRKTVKDYLFTKRGLYCCDIVTFNTIALKGAIDDVCRALYKSEYPKNLIKKIEEETAESGKLLSDTKKECERFDKQYLEISDQIKSAVENDEVAARKKYPDVFKYVDLLNGVVVSVGNHPAGCVVSPFPVESWFGTFTTATDEYPISLLNMKEIDSLNFVKLDILGLDNIGLIYKTCEAAGIPFLTPDNTPDDDMDVWNSIKEDTTMIFQWESQSATAYLKQLFSEDTVKKIREKNSDFSYMNLLSVGNGAIRPAGESYRDKLSQGIYQDNGNEALNKFLAPTLGYCIEESQIVSTVGARKKIRDVNIGDKVYTKSGISSVTHKIYMGVKPTILVETSNGDITCTDDHKLFTDEGWKPASDVKNNSIAIRVGNENKEHEYVNKLRLIGYLLGDGILTGGNNVGFVNRDIDVINDICRIGETFDNCTASVANRKSRVNKLDLYYVNFKHLVPHKYPTSISRYLKEIGLKTDNGGALAVNKKIPEFIYCQDTEGLLQFIGAYTDTDSHVGGKGGVCVGYRTSSKDLKDGIIEVLRLIGFTASVTPDEKTKSYYIGIQNAPKFIEIIYNYSFKVRKVFPDRDFGNPTKIKFNLIPTQRVIDAVIKNNISLKQIEKKCGVNMYKSKFTTVRTLRKIMAEFGEVFPSFWFDENIVWSPVNSITSIGERNVYDLTIEGEHNFVCQGYVVHNCVYQEQIIEFLHKFCGFTMGEADIIRRHFSKKTGTEKDIPIIKDGGYLNKGHYIKGFIQTMKDDYGIEKDEAEKIIANFLQVIIDASDYLFSKNHADPYSWIGYICGYLRYHYPLEFITTALNIFEGKEEKSLAIINYAKKQGIRISPIKFRHSIAQYSFSKDTNEIFKGISSIKYMNSNIADEMYTLRNNIYSSFADLLYDIDKKTSVNSRQLKILISLDFFDEFGDASLLNTIYEMYGNLAGKVQFKKAKLEALHIPEEIARKYSQSESATQFARIDVTSMLNELSKTIKVEKRTLKEKVAAQLECLGYIDVADDRFAGIAAVIDIDAKYSPKLKMYSLKNGTTLDCKIDKQTFRKQKIEKGDIIKITSTKNRPKSRKNESGEWESVPGTNELWITAYHKIENL